MDTLVGGYLGNEKEWKWRSKTIPYLWVNCGILLVTISDKSESDRSKYFLFKLVDIAILCTFMHWCEYWAEPLAETLVIWLRHSLNAFNCFSIYIDSMAQIKDLARWRWNSSKWNIRQIGWKTEVNFTSHFLPVPAQHEEYTSWWMLSVSNKYIY